MNAPQSTPARRASQRHAPQQGEAPVTRRTQWVRGSVASWGLGVTLGLILGVGLLIATPQLMGKPAEATPASTAPANANENGPADAGTSETGASESAAGEAASGDAASGDMAAGAGASSAAGEAATGGAADTAGDTGAAGDAQAGQTVYVGNCAGCHGANGQGQIGPSLVTADGPKSWTLAQFTTTLREGKTPDRELSATMPRYGEAQISDAQVADLQAYIKTLN
ncbi:c-type cytochrome [Deinococcus sp. RM]|uniref:c-type cytochrome n=1 Tax=Deinococcus sp. RM TaxID=2316359 RepID=UPI0018F580DB|nr:cytochrome c [Deinococcus sp. RM]